MNKAYSNKALPMGTVLREWRIEEVLGAGAAMLPQDAHGATLAGWTFETLPSGSTTAASVGPFAAESGVGTAFGVHASATSVFSNNAGNGSIAALNANGWTGGNSDYYEFRTSSTGFQDLQVSWDQTRSGTGPNSFDLQYSTDGSTFKNQGDCVSYTNTGR